jgi:PKD repeat protein
MKHYFLKILTAGLFFTVFFNACEDYTEDFPVPEASIVVDFTVSDVEELTFPLEINFRSESIIPDRISEYSYRWDFGDGESSNEENPTHTYSSPGLYTVILTVKADSETHTAEKELDLRGSLFEEDFEETGGLIPEDWVLVNVDGNVPNSSGLASMADSAWIVTNSSYFESNIAMGVSYYDPEAGADDWMILPKVSLGNNSLLTWDAMSLTSSGNYPDSYEVYVSTTTQDIEGCNANGVAYSVIDESVGTDAGGEGIITHELDLSDYAGMDVYIAFRLMTPDPGGDRLAIDNIKIVEP